ncbi:MAG: Crp/Fnr family transcriptional regulator [Pseudomonadota bacterium]
MNLTESIQRLKGVGLLSALSEDALRLVAFNCDVKTLDDGAALYFHGEEAHGAILLLTGALDLEAYVSGKPVSRGRIEAEAVIDPYAMIVPSKRTETGRASGEISYLTIDRGILRRVISEYPEVAEVMHDFIARHMSETVTEVNRIARRIDDLDRDNKTDGQ